MRPFGTHLHPHCQSNHRTPFTITLPSLRRLLPVALRSVPSLWVCDHNLTLKEPRDWNPFDAPSDDEGKRWWWSMPTTLSYDMALAGKIISQQSKCHDSSLKVSRWSNWTVCCHPASQPHNEWWLWDPSTCRYHVPCGIPMWNNPPPHHLNYLTILRYTCGTQCKQMRT